MTPMKMELTLFGERVSEDENGFICLNDLWRAAGAPNTLRPGEWRRSKRTKVLAEVVAKEIMGDSRNSANKRLKSAPCAPIYATGRGRTSRTYAHVILALDYTEWLNPELGVEVRKVFLRYRANDMTLAREMMQRIRAQHEEDVERIEARETFTHHYRRFRGRARDAGCETKRDYAFVGSGGYDGFYGGISLEDVRILKELPPGAPLPPQAPPPVVVPGAMQHLR